MALKRRLMELLMPPPEENNLPGTPHEKRLLENANAFPSEIFKPAVKSPLEGFLLALFFGGVGGVFFYGVFQILPEALAEPNGMKRLVKFISLGMGVVLGSMGVLLGILCIPWAISASRGEVELQAGGFRDYRRGKTTHVPWSEVERIVETIRYERLLESDIRSFVVHAKGGRKFRYAGDNVLLLERFIELLMNRAERYSIPWETVDKVR